MQTAHVLLSLGGDHGNTVSKFGCTAAEIAVLREIHGNDAVREIEPQKDIKRTHREERVRLLNIYGAAKNEDHKSIVEGMFPGVAARVFENLDELDLDDSFFKATERLRVKPAAIADEAVADDAPAHDAEVETDEDGVGEMTDEHADKDILG